MTTTCSSSPGRGVVRVAGGVDLAAAPGLRELLEQACADPVRPVVVDLSGVTFMDCAGLGVLLEAAARAGDRLSLRGTPRPVAELLRLASGEMTEQANGLLIGRHGGDWEQAWQILVTSLDRPRPGRL